MFNSSTPLRSQISAAVCCWPFTLTKVLVSSSPPPSLLMSMLSGMPRYPPPGSALWTTRLKVRVSFNAFGRLGQTRTSGLPPSWRASSSPAIFWNVSTIQATEPERPKYIPLPKCGSALSATYDLDGMSNGPAIDSSLAADRTGLNCCHIRSAWQGMLSRKRCIKTCAW